MSKSIVLTSNNRFEQQYIDEQTDNPETYTAFCRRFTGGIWEMYQYAANDEEALLPVSIDVIVIKEWFLKIIEKYELSSRKYKKIKSVANMLLDYAVEKRLVSINVIPL